MFNAAYFTYDGVYSGIFGLRIAKLGADSMEETSFIKPTFQAVKGIGTPRFLYSRLDTDEPPEYRLTVLSENPIPDIVKREILVWLHVRNGFKTLQIHQPEFEGYSYHCVFTDIDLIYISGNCFGFNLTARFDSRYGYGKEQVVRVESDGTMRMVKLINRSDVRDTYTYPVVRFTVRGDTDGGKSIQILNRSDPMSEPFEFAGIRSNATVKVDNELKIIQSSYEGETLSCFNRNWLRLVAGVNKLEILLNGEAEIICPTYVLIGF